MRGMPVYHTPMCDVPGCNQPAIGRCTSLTRWQVCPEHFLPAASVGFMPDNFGEESPVTPQQAMDMRKERLAETSSVAT